MSLPGSPRCSPPRVRGPAFFKVGRAAASRYHFVTIIIIMNSPSPDACIITAFVNYPHALSFFLWLLDSLLFIFGLVSYLSISVSLCVLSSSLCVLASKMLSCRSFRVWFLFIFCMVGMGGNINHRMKALHSLEFKAWPQLNLQNSTVKASKHACFYLLVLLVSRDGFGLLNAWAGLVGACEMSRAGCRPQSNDDDSGLDLPKLESVHVSACHFVRAIRE